jgi:hypothetical protein
MIIKVQKFGAIKNAEIDLSKKLSVFCDQTEQEKRI